MILADTTFLIDLQRSTRNIRHQAAARWLEINSEKEIALPSVVLGEFAEGFEASDHPLIEHFRSAHQIIAIDDAVAILYSRIARTLRMNGNLIGGNDMWIAATALSVQAPLLTRNVAHFNRVDGLQVEAYGVEE